MQGVDSEESGTAADAGRIPSSSCESQIGSGARERCEEPFAPGIGYGKKAVLAALYVSGFGALLVFVDQFRCSGILQPNICLTYVALAWLPVVVGVESWLRHEKALHAARLEDLSEVAAMIVEARYVEPRLKDPQRPEDYERKREELNQEVKRLQDGIGSESWTEYQVLSLNQLLVDFLKVDDLTVRAQSTLEDLQEYSDLKYNADHYEVWKYRIEDAIGVIQDKVKDGQSAVEVDDAAEKLRARLRTLLEHVADYDKYWAEGAAIFWGIVRCGVVSVPVLLTMGLLPVLHPSGDLILGLANWGFLGVSGALSAVLLGCGCQPCNAKSIPDIKLA